MIAAAAPPQLKRPVMFQSMVNDVASPVTAACMGPSTLKVLFLQVPVHAPTYFVGSKAPAGLTASNPTITIATTSRRVRMLR